MKLTPKQYFYLWSTLAVASSMSSILLCRSKALARHTNCFCPTLKLLPASASSPYSCSGNWSTFSFSCTWIQTNWSMVVKSGNLKLENVLVNGLETVSELLGKPVSNWCHDRKTIAQSRSLLQGTPMLTHSPLRLPSKPGYLQTL